ncbi:MAG TPA: twin-arginine translocation signal domain-containing protein, partial [Acidimicrobiales bacterium]|nr:twin-arginine translocation signal domain-containing protein [Acidimicrobiales bacterium]
MTDPSTRELLEALSVPMAADDAGAWTRRRFLAATAATGAAATVLPAWLGDVAESATPIGPNDGVVVVILMGGGNDGLNMVPPVGNGRYHDLRKGIAIDERTALDIGQGHGLHPALTGVAARWAKGEVAVVHGVGDVAPDLSHFAAMARWMSAITTGAPTSSGWLGRWLDGYGRADDLAAIALGSSVPLTLVGAARKATALPSNGGGGLLGKHEEPWVERSIQCMREMGAGATGTGAWADALAAAGRGAMDMAEIVQPVYAAPLSDAKLT